MFGANELQLNADIIFHEDNAQDSQDNSILKMNLDSYKTARRFVIYSNCLRKNLYER
jgi:NADH:ubiquinone oxidoreductase subunit